MDLLGLLGLEAHARGRARRRRVGHRGLRAGAQAGQRPLRQLHDHVVIDGAGRRDDDRGRHVAAGVEVGDVGDRRVADHRRAADDRAAQRVVAEDRVAEHVEDRVLRVVLVHRDLLEHDLALGIDVVERRAPDHVGDDVERARQMLVEHPRVDRRALLVGAGVELGAHPVEELVDLRGPVALGAAEQHVLEEVGQPRLLGPLAARAGAHEEPEGRGSHGGHVPP